MNTHNDKKEKIKASFVSLGKKLKSFFSKVGHGMLHVLKKLWEWTRRMFLGASSTVARDKERNKEIENREYTPEELLEKEMILSPGRQVIKNFFSKKIAVGALIVVICMFLLVIIGPACMKETYSDSYLETYQTNLSPSLNNMKVPKELKNDIKKISSYGMYTVGLSNSGNLYVWGNSKIATAGIDLKNIPEEIRNANIVDIAAGVDHVVAIGDDGKVYAWGLKNLGQYGTEGSDVKMPEELINGKLEINNYKKVECGYQTTAIVMNDGTTYVWGNNRAVDNLESVSKLANVEDIVFMQSTAVALLKDGTISTGNAIVFKKATNANGEKKTLNEAIGSHKVVKLVADATCIAFILDNDEIWFAGNFKYNEYKMPTLESDEKIKEIKAGARHFTVLTDKGNVYSWGGNVLGQCKVPKKAHGADDIFVGSFQNYTVNESDELTATWGNKGYIFGTDANGASIFKRVINGGKMTMTIGAVSVIISTIIGIIVGCLAGYFGGRVDMILMRVIEIFSAIPFLPFAMILSSLMSRLPVSDNMRIFIIMLILGVLSWPGLARLVRGQVLAEREKEFVTAAKAMGVKEVRIAFKHILPNIISVILVTLTLDFAGCMLTESSLSYLGFGVMPPSPTWGNMLNKCNNALIIENYWWQWLFPSIFLAITTICINIIGDSLRDVMDPKSSIEK